MIQYLLQYIYCNSSLEPTQMSTSNLLTGRARAMSHASIRKRLIRSSSEQKKQMQKNTTSQSFRPKLQRLLQQNKIEFIMNTDPHTKANLFYTTHINEMEKELSCTKKSLSTMVMKTKSKQYNINRLKNQLTRMQRDICILKGQSEVNKNKLQNVKEKFEKKKDTLEEKVWMEKTYKHIKQRLQKDQQFLKAKHAVGERDIVQLQREKKILEGNLHQLTQLNRKLDYNLDVAKKISKQQTDEKNQFIQLLNLQMAEKDMLNDLKIEKINREDQIKQLMPSVIQKQQLLKYMEILFTHKLVSQIVKTKSQRLMEKYSHVQNAYMHIKSNTNIVQLGKILARMETQDQEYESLLRKVDTLQKQLQSHQKQLGKAIQKQHQILSMDTNDNQTTKITYKGTERDNYDVLVREKDKLSQRKGQDDILKKRIINWVQQHAALFDIDMKGKNQQNFFKDLSLLQSCIKKKISRKSN